MIENNVTPIVPVVLPEDPAALLAMVRGMGLFKLLQTKAEILNYLEERGGDITDGEVIMEVLEVADDLSKLKIDRVCGLIKGSIPLHRQALKDQLKKLDAIEEKVDLMVIEAIRSQGEDAKQIDGLAWRARIQNNPPKVVIDNEDVIPDMFKRGVVSIVAKFDPLSSAKQYWTDLVRDISQQTVKGDALGTVNCDIDMAPDNAMLREVMLDKKDKKGEVTAEGIPVDGAHIEIGCHVRYEPGKAKASAIAGKTGKK